MYTRQWLLKPLSRIMYQGMYTYTFDRESADDKVSVRHHRSGSDVELLVWSHVVLSNVVSPVLLTLSLLSQVMCMHVCVCVYT